MLKQYPMLRYVLQKGFWYLLTFVFAVALNFALPRLGDNNPVDIIMGQAGKGLSPTEAQKKKAELLVSFGMAELDDQGNVIYEPEARRQARRGRQSGARDREGSQRRWHTEDGGTPEG